MSARVPALCALAALAIAVPAWAQDTSPAPAAPAGGIEQKAATCAACHGAQGVPIDHTIPVIWGQQAGYIYIELRDFKRGNRKSDIMSPMAASLSRDDMMALAEYFSKKPWPNLGQKPAAPDVVSKAEVAANSGQCTQCHLGGYLGGSTTPRLAGQCDEYLYKTMLDFRSGARANNSWMTDLLKNYDDAAMKDMAAYLAGM